MGQRKHKQWAVALSGAAFISSAARFSVDPGGWATAFASITVLCVGAATVLQVLVLRAQGPRKGFVKFAEDRLRAFKVQHLEKGAGGDFPTLELLGLSLLVRKRPSRSEQKALRANGQSEGPFFYVLARASGGASDSESRIPEGEGLVNFARARSASTYKSLKEPYQKDSVEDYAGACGLSPETAKTLTRARLPTEFIVCPFTLAPDPDGARVRNIHSDPRAWEKNAILIIDHPDPYTIARFMSGDEDGQEPPEGLIQALDELAESFRERWAEFHGADAA